MYVRIQLALEIHLDGRTWVAGCEALDLTTQAPAKQGALRGIKEAIELWFETYIDRNVLAQALQESGFTRETRRESTPDDAFNIVTTEPDSIETDNNSQDYSDAATLNTVHFATKRKRGQEYLEGFVPAMLVGDSGLHYAYV